MTETVVVQIIGAPIACSDGYKDTWREVSEWASGQLKNLFGDSVDVIYFDLFDPNCPQLPLDAKLPVVLVDNQVLVSGGKVSIPLIRKRLLDLGVKVKVN